MIEEIVTFETNKQTNKTTKRLSSNHQAQGEERSITELSIREHVEFIVQIVEEKAQEIRNNKKKTNNNKKKPTISNH